MDLFGFSNEKLENTNYLANFSKNIFALSSSKRFILIFILQLAGLQQLFFQSIALGMEYKQKKRARTRFD